MKSTLKLIAILLATGLAVACSRNENTSQGKDESDADSIVQVAPSGDGTPTDGSSPSNPGSPPDSAAQAVDADSIR